MRSAYKKQGVGEEFVEIGKAKRTEVCGKVMNYRLGGILESIRVEYPVSDPMKYR